HLPLKGLRSDTNDAAHRPVSAPHDTAFIVGCLRNYCECSVILQTTHDERSVPPFIARPRIDSSLALRRTCGHAEHPRIMPQLRVTCVDANTPTRCPLC